LPQEVITSETDKPKKEVIMKNLFTSAFVLLISTQANALDILCVDQDIQDSQVTAHFKGKHDHIKVMLGIPTGETSSEDASGACVGEEDSAELSLRCDEVKTKSGETYFVRLDDRRATVAKNGKVIVNIPCDKDTDQE